MFNKKKQLDLIINENGLIENIHYSGNFHALWIMHVIPRNYLSRKTSS